MKKSQHGQGVFGPAVCQYLDSLCSVQENPIFTEFLDFITDVCISCMNHKEALLPKKLIDLVYSALAEAMGSNTLPEETMVYLSHI